MSANPKATTQQPKDYGGRHTVCHMCGEISAPGLGVTLWTRLAIAGYALVELCQTCADIFTHGGRLDRMPQRSIALHRVTLEHVTPTLDATRWRIRGDRKRYAHQVTL